MATIDDAVWTTAYINTLLDSAFLFIEGGGEKDDEGKTKPRSLRHFPYKDASGKVDLPHLRNAIARIPQSEVPGLDKEALQEKARRILEQNQDTDVEKIDTGDLAGGGKKAPARFSESFLRRGNGVAFTVSKLDLERIKSGEYKVLVKAEKCADVESCEFLVLQGEKVHGLCKLGSSFEMSSEDLTLTEGIHGISKDLAEILWPGREVYYGYRILEKNFEGDSVDVEMTGSQHWVFNVKPRVEMSYVTIDVFKSVTNDRVVGAAVLIPGVPDLHEDIYDELTVRNAAYSFMENYFSDNSHGINVMHKGKIITRGIRVLQSYILEQETTFPCELSAASEDHLSKNRDSITYPVGTWIMYARILDDALWEATKSGEFTGWSIQGVANIRVLDQATQ